MKKLLSILIVTILLLTGCTSQTTSEVEEIELSTWAGGEELAELQTIVDEVNAENTEKYHIVIQSIPSDYYLKMQTEFSAGQGPDIMWIEQNQLAPLASQNVLLPLEDYVDASELKDYTFNQEVINTASYNNSLYGVPWIANPMIMYFNKDIVSQEDQLVLQENNLTMQEFYDMAKKYQTQDTNGVLLNGWPPYEYFVWNFGGEIEDVDGNVQFNSEQGLNATQYIADAIINDPITPDMETINAAGYTETFQQGNTAFLMGGTSDKVETIGSDPVGFEIGYSTVPGEFTYNWSASYALTKDSENPDLAFEALKDLTLKTWEWKLVPPIDITELGYENYEVYLNEKAPEKVQMSQVVEQSMNMTHDYSYSIKSAKIYQVIWDEIYAPILNARVTSTTVNVKELLDNAQKKIESE